jgi:hypothetical protein
MEEEEELPTVLKGEVKNIITQLKNNKTPGEEGVINECLKWGEQDIKDPITTLFNRILVLEIIPQQWFTSTIILLHKKGTKDNPNNYRPICLLSNMYKLLIKILTNQITVTLDENQPCKQAGFRAKFSTTDHLQTINHVIEKTQEFNLSLYLAFIDYKKASDSVEHTSVMKALNSAGIHLKIVRLLGRIYQESRAKVKTEIESETFRTKRGVRQGDPISLKLFTCVLEAVFRNLSWNDMG